MKKILLAVSKPQVHPAGLDFACYIARLIHSQLTGVFLKDEAFEPEPYADDTNFSSREAPAISLPHQGAISKGTNQDVHYFLDACTQRGVKAHILIRGKMDNNRMSPVEEIINESRFADLLILDPEISYNKNGGEVPTQFVKDVQAGAECPVIISPNIFSGIDEIVFCYDGDRSSVFAMKQFTYLFPQYTDKTVTILDIGNHKKTGSANEKIKSWLSCSYSGIGFHEPHGNTPDELFEYLLTKNNTFVVMGAYGKNLLSRSFKKGGTDMIIRLIDLPMFIAHH